MNAQARAALARSRLGREGGVLLCRIADDDTIAALAAEAFATQPAAARADVGAPPLDGEQRGQPERAIATSVGGPELARFYLATATRTLLARATGVAWRPLGDQGTFSFYGPGDHLGAHRDAPGCDVAVITCLYDDGAPGDVGGDLVVYPGRSRDTLASIRADPRRGAHRLRLAPGCTAIVLGGTVPHLVTPIGAGRLRLVAPLCYTAA